VHLLGLQQLFQFLQWQPIVEIPELLLLVHRPQISLFGKQSSQWALLVNKFATTITDSSERASVQNITFNPSIVD